MANTCAFLQSTSPLDEVAPLLLLQRKPRKHPRIKNFSNLQARSGVATGKTETQTAHVPRLRGNKPPKQSHKLGWLQGPSEVARKREQARSSQWRRRPGESREGSRFGCLIGSVWPGRPSPQPLASCHLSPIDTSPFLSKPPNPARQAHFPCDDGSWVDGETSQL